MGDSDLVGCDTILLGECFLMSGSNGSPSYSRIGSMDKTSEDECDTFL